MSRSRLGIRMNGTEDRFLSLILSKARERGSLSLFELGTAEGGTLSGIWQMLISEGIEDYTLVGCDLPAGWSCDRTKLAATMNRLGCWWGAYDRPEVAPQKGAQIYFVDGRVLIRALNERYGFSPDVSFIDGCHSSRCVTADFEAVAPTVVPGGLVIFHDAGVEEQGSDWQGHCGEFINVRKAIQDLGLLDGKRPGWRLVEEIRGDRDRGGEGNSHVVVKREAV